MLAARLQRRFLSLILHLQSTRNLSRPPVHWRRAVTVHEKSILLAVLPAAMLLSQHTVAAAWFMLVSTFSMYPLLAKDGLTSEYFGVCAVFAATVVMSLNTGCAPKSIALRVLVGQPAECIHPVVAAVAAATRTTSLTPPHRPHSLQAVVSVLGMASIHLLMAFVAPPPRLPDLFTVACCAFSFLHFVAFWVYFHYQQLMCSSEPKLGGRKSHAE